MTGHTLKVRRYLPRHSSLKADMANVRPRSSFSKAC